MLGLLLKSFSIGHELILLRQRNPLVYLTGEQFSVFTPESQARAIQNAALVCYRSWNENKKPEKWVRFWQWKIRRMDHGKAIQDFLNYRAAGHSSPPPPGPHAKDVTAEEGEKEGRQYGAPFLCRLFNFVAALPDREIRVFGDTAYDFPMGLGCFLYLSWLEAEGRARIENEEEARLQKEYEELSAGTTPIIPMRGGL